MIYIEFVALFFLTTEGWETQRIFNNQKACVNYMLREQDKIIQDQAERNGVYRCIKMQSGMFPDPKGTVRGGGKEIRL